MNSCCLHPLLHTCFASHLVKTAAVQGEQLLAAPTDATHRFVLADSIPKPVLSQLRSALTGANCPADGHDQRIALACGR